jgi:hypothetical protein
MIKIISATVLALLAASCQSNSSSRVDLARSYPPATFEAANANCRMQALAQQPGLYARGTPNYVPGAQRRNAIRMEQSYRRCMSASGWNSTSS